MMRKEITLEEAFKLYPKGVEEMQNLQDMSKAVKAPSVPRQREPRFGEVLREKEKFSLRGVVYVVRRARSNGKLTIKSIGLDLQKQPAPTFKDCTADSGKEEG